MPTVLEPKHFPLYSVHSAVFSKASAMPILQCADAHMAADVMTRLNRDAQQHKDWVPPDEGPLEAPACLLCAQGVPRHQNPARGWLHKIDESRAALCTREPGRKAPADAASS